MTTRCSRWPAPAPARSRGHAIEPGRDQNALGTMLQPVGAGLQVAAKGETVNDFFNSVARERHRLIPRRGKIRALAAPLIGRAATNAGQLRREPSRWPSRKVAITIAPSSSVNVG